MSIPRYSDTPIHDNLELLHEAYADTPTRNPMELPQEDYPNNMSTWATSGFQRGRRGHFIGRIRKHA